jgi:acetoacetate decarboxylase
MTEERYEGIVKQHYDADAFFGRLGYPSGEQPYSCESLRSVSVVCQGDAGNLERLLAGTPFELADDRFVVQIADFGNATVGAFYDSGVIVPVRYGDHSGATFLFEYEDQPWSVAFGREVWGYPKEFAEVSLEDSETGAVGKVWRTGELIFSMAVDYQDHDAQAAAAGGTQADPGRGLDESPASDLTLYPHLQVHALPAADRRGFSAFEIVARDTSSEFALESRRCGSASVKFGPAVSIGGVQLEVVQVLGGEYTVGDYTCSADRGRAAVIDRLV